MVSPEVVTNAPAVRWALPISLNGLKINLGDSSANANPAQRPQRRQIKYGVPGSSEVPPEVPEVPGSSRREVHGGEHFPMCPQERLPCCGLLSFWSRLNAVLPQYASDGRIGKLHPKVLQRALDPAAAPWS